MIAKAAITFIILYDEENEILRKLNLTQTEQNIRAMAKRGELYSFYGLTENADYDKHEKPYVTEHFRFSVEGDAQDAAMKTEAFVKMLGYMQGVYIQTMNINAPLFVVKNVKYKVAPYKTVVIDLDVENVKGAFVTIVNCAGPDRHQFHASDIWVRANAGAEVWKSLFDYNEDSVVTTDVPFALTRAEEAEKWLEKVKDARNIAKECITTTGEPTQEQKEELLVIMRR